MKIKELKKQYDFSCVMANLDIDIHSIAEKIIDKKDLYLDNNKKDESIYGIEDKSHVTILYGLHNDIKENEVLDILKLFKEIKIKLISTSTFDSKDYDVLKFDVESESLFTMNNIFTKMFEYTTDYPNYNPHITIAYLKKGTAKKYIDKFHKIINEEGLSEIKIDEYIYSSNKKEYYISVNDTEEEIDESIILKLEDFL